MNKMCNICNACNVNNVSDALTHRTPDTGHCTVSYCTVLKHYEANIKFLVCGHHIEKTRYYVCSTAE